MTASGGKGANLVADKGSSPGALLERLAWLSKHVQGLSNERQRLWATPHGEWSPDVAQRIRHLTAWLEDAYGEKRQARSSWRATRKGSVGMVRGLRAPRDTVGADS